METESLQVGDVIAFINPDDDKTVVTHRIVKISLKEEETTFITRGDANNADDDSLPADKILGRVNVAIPFIGFLMSFARTKRRSLLTLSNHTQMGY